MPIPITAWSVLRPSIMTFTFNTIKEIAGNSGMDLTQLSHLNQGAARPVSKGQLLGAMDRVFGSMESQGQQSFLTYFISEMVSRNDSLEESISTYLERIGWGINDGAIYPLELQIDLELGTFDEEAKEKVKQAIIRYRSGDLSGAVTSICGIIDRKTQIIYSVNGIADHAGASFVEKVSVSINTMEASFKGCIGLAITDENERNRVWKDHKKSITTAATVLGSYRRNASDTHGQLTMTSPKLVQDAIDKSLFVLRGLT